MPTLTITQIKDEKEIEFLRDAYSKATIDLLKKNLKLKDSLYLLAKKGAGFAGFCSVDRDWWEDGFFFIREILVDPNLQRLGLGKELMGRCIEHAKSKKAIGVVTETAFENAPMRNLCEKLDFKEWDNPEWKEGVTYKLVFVRKSN